MCIVSVTCHQQALSIPQFILLLSEFCIIISLILLYSVLNINNFEILVVKFNRSLGKSIYNLVCETPLKKFQTILPAQLNLVPFSLLCGGKLFSSQMLKLEMFVEKACFSNNTYSTFL